MTDRAAQAESLANRLRDLLNDCWDADVQVVHGRDPGDTCRGDYHLEPRDGADSRIVAWMPLAEKWTVRP